MPGLFGAVDRPQDKHSIHQAAPQPLSIAKCTSICLTPAPLPHPEPMAIFLVATIMVASLFAVRAGPPRKATHTLHFTDPSHWAQEEMPSWPHSMDGHVEVLF